LIFCLRERYTAGMITFPTAQPAPAIKRRSVQVIALAYATILSIFVVTQLYSFDDFILIIDSLWLPGGIELAQVIAAVIVIVELFALPFLLRMKLSQAFRGFSMGCGWVAAGLWLVANIWVATTTNEISNIGYLGSVIAVEPGLVSWLVAILLVALSVISSWGMHSKKTK